MKQYYNQMQGRDFSDSISNIEASFRTNPSRLEKSNYGIAGNTFRAYRGYDHRPSLVYQSWANEKTKEILDPKQEVPSSQETFDQWHSDLFDSINDHWESRQGQSLSLAHAYKMVDLYLKWLTSIQDCPENLCRSIVNYGYCALDSQILKKLNECLSGALPIRNPSMGDIQNKNTYNYCQYLITNFAQHYGGTRVLFDYFAWKPGGASVKVSR